MEQEYRQEWVDYEKRLIDYGYDAFEIEEIKNIREGVLEPCTFEMFTELFKQGIVSRTRKLKKARNLYTDGKFFYYLDHYTRRYETNGYFKTEENDI